MNSKKLGTMPIGKLLWVMSVPAIFSMLIQALYNIVDGIYVSKLGDEAFYAVNISFPMQMLIIAFALGIGVGTNSLIARKLGEKKNEDANQAAKTGIVLSLIIGVIFVIVGLTLTRPYLSLTSNDESQITLGSQYLMIVMSLSIGAILEITITKILQATGNMIIPMFCQLLGAIANIILDPIFIFSLGLGIKGAAIATIIGQFLALGLALSSFVFQKQEINISLRNFRFQMRNLIGILHVGLPVTIMNSITSITTAILNTFLSQFTVNADVGEAAINVLGAYFKLQSFFFMPVFGLNQGAMPILGYNFGANNKHRFIKTIKLMLFTAFIIMLLGFLTFQLIPNTLISIFTPSQLMLDINIIALPIISLHFIPAIFGIIYSVSFQSIGHGIKSLLMSLLRQLIIIIPSAYLLIRYLGLNKIWYCFIIAEVITDSIFVPIAIVTINREFHKKQLETNN